MIYQTNTLISHVPTTSPYIMGCTSSVPNTSTTNAIFTDKCVQYEEEYTEESESSTIAQKANENDSKVLPSCDNLVEPLHLVRSHKSLVDLVGSMPNSDNVPLSQDSTTVSENKKDEVEDDKISRLEEVIEKVIELYEADKNNIHEKLQESPNICEETPIGQDKQDIEESHKNQVENVVKDAEQIVDPGEEIMSPTQSESSRVTRWEALADIAAELPASLTIDPLTGQIYALSK